MMGKPVRDVEGSPERRHAGLIFLVFLKLGLSSFGGPIAHLGYFRDTFVVRRKWLTEHAYGSLVGLCQILPGPASSQVGFAIGLQQGGMRGALAAFAGFTLPSALLMLAAAWGLKWLPTNLRTPLFHGLVLVAAPIVAHAVIGMAQRLCTGWLTASIATLAAAALIVFDLPWLAPALIVAGGLAGIAFLHDTKGAGSLGPVGFSRAAGMVCLALFLTLLIGLPLAATLAPFPALQLADGFYRTGALVFGGGHVILPLLEAETAARGWIAAEPFLAGYGAAQALPGPLTAFAAYLGAVSETGLDPLIAGLIALLAIFAPGLLLIAGAMPLWNRVSERGWMAGLSAGAGAAVVGVLGAALWRPVISSAVLGPADWAIALAGLAGLMLRAPVWQVVIGVALAGAYSSVG